MPHRICVACDSPDCSGPVEVVLPFTTPSSPMKSTSLIQTSFSSPRPVLRPTTDNIRRAIPPSTEKLRARASPSNYSTHVNLMDGSTLCKSCSSKVLLNAENEPSPHISKKKDRIYHETTPAVEFTDLPTPRPRPPTPQPTPQVLIHPTLSPQLQDVFPRTTPLSQTLHQLDDLPVPCEQAPLPSDHVINTGFLDDSQLPPAPYWRDIVPFVVDYVPPVSASFRPVLSSPASRPIDSPLRTTTGDTHSSSISTIIPSSLPSSLSLQDFFGDTPTLSPICSEVPPSRPVFALNRAGSPLSGVPPGIQCDTVQSPNMSLKHPSRDCQLSYKDGIIRSLSVERDMYQQAVAESRVRRFGFPDSNITYSKPPEDILSSGSSATKSTPDHFQRLPSSFPVFSSLEFTRPRNLQDHSDVVAQLSGLFESLASVCRTQAEDNKQLVRTGLDTLEELDQHCSSITEICGSHNQNSL